MVKHPIKDELHQVAIFIAVIWGLFLLDFVVPGDFTHFGVIPRTLRGIIGIVASPFLHGGFGHIASNTVPLAILLVLLAGSRARSWMIVAAVSIGGGTLLWLFGRTAIHVGASGLIYGLIAFLIVSGILERRLVPMIISIGVGFAYGSTLLSGVLPTVGGNVSWDGHLTGAIAGACVAWGLVRESSKDQ